MFRKLSLVPVLLTAIAAPAATLQQLSMDRMIDLATSVVQARVTASSASVDSASGVPTIYTHYKLQVSDVWKGAPLTEVTMPGGAANGQRQSFPGVPELKIGGEYVLFLWKSPTTGSVQTIGLTQGIFEVAPQASGGPVAIRHRGGELMVDSSGKRVESQAIRMKLADMRSRVHRAPAAGSVAR